MTKTGLDWPQRQTLWRRRALELAGGATAFTFWRRKPHGPLRSEHFVERLAADRIADRDPLRPPILIDAETCSSRKSADLQQSVNQLTLGFAGVGLSSSHHSVGVPP